MSLAQILLQRGADPNLANGHGRDGRAWTSTTFKAFPLEIACYDGHAEIARLLLRSGADPNKGYPLLALAESFRMKNQSQVLEMLKTMADYGVDVNRRNIRNDTSLQAFIRRGNYQCAYKLMELGAEIDAHASKLSWGRTALQAAAECGSVEMVKYLLSRGANVNAPAASNNGATALQAAAIKGHLRITQILLENGADVDAEPSPSQGRRAIEGAAESGRLDTVKLLLDNYAGPKSKKELCSSALKYARDENQWHIVDLLEAYKE